MQPFILNGKIGYTFLVNKAYDKWALVFKNGYIRDFDVALKLGAHPQYGEHLNHSGFQVLKSGANTNVIISLRHNRRALWRIIDFLYKVVPDNAFDFSFSNKNKSDVILILYSCSFLVDIRNVSAGEINRFIHLINKFLINQEFNVTVALIPHHTYFRKIKFLSTEGKSNYYLPAQSARQLRKEAGQHGTYLSAYVRQILIDYANKHN